MQEKNRADAVDRHIQTFPDFYVDFSFRNMALAQQINN